MLRKNLPFSSYSASIGLVRWNKNMWPGAFTATAEVSPAIMSWGNLKKLVTTRYGNSGTAWKGREATADAWAQASRGDTAINISTIASQFLRCLTVLGGRMVVCLAQNNVRGKECAKNLKQAASVGNHDRHFGNGDTRQDAGQERVRAEKQELAAVGVWRLGGLLRTFSARRVYWG